MGTSADDFLNSQSLRKTAQNAFRHYDESDMDSMVEAAEDLAATDGIPFKTAIEIMSGQTRLPYGTTPKNG